MQLKIYLACCLKINSSRSNVFILNKSPFGCFEHYFQVQKQGAVFYVPYVIGKAFVSGVESGIGDRLFIFKILFKIKSLGKSFWIFAFYVEKSLFFNSIVFIVILPKVFIKAFLILFNRFSNRSVFCNYKKSRNKSCFLGKIA